MTTAGTGLLASPADSCSSVLAAATVDAPTSRSGAPERFLIFMNTCVVPPVADVENVHGCTISSPFLFSLWAHAAGAAIAATRSRRRAVLVKPGRSTRDEIIGPI